MDEREKKMKEIVVKELVKPTVKPEEDMDEIEARFVRSERPTLG